jgi:hypothetical protein
VVELSAPFSAGWLFFEFDFGPFERPIAATIRQVAGFWPFFLPADAHGASDGVINPINTFTTP